MHACLNKKYTSPFPFYLIKAVSGKPPIQRVHSCSTMVRDILLLYFTLDSQSLNTKTLKSTYQNIGGKSNHRYQERSTGPNEQRSSCQKTDFSQNWNFFISNGSNQFEKAGNSLLIFKAILKVFMCQKTVCLKRREHCKNISD